MCLLVYCLIPPNSSTSVSLPSSPPKCHSGNGNAYLHLLEGNYVATYDDDDVGGLLVQVLSLNEGSVQPSLVGLIRSNGNDGRTQRAAAAGSGAILWLRKNNQLERSALIMTA